MARALFAGLPVEFSPPEMAARRIVELGTRAEREAYWLRIPEAWRPFIADFAKLFLGLHIAELPMLEQRRQALEQVPAMWLDDVRWHATYLYRSRDARAEYRAEQAAKRGAA